ncbi:MAG: DUF429 domain-containing protein [Rhodopila sp.]|jgi:predicted RNase H-like nuclease
MDTLVGFDSAWVGNPNKPGAICALTLYEGRPIKFLPPKLVGFDEALTFCQEARSSSQFTLLALDQPTIVWNTTGMRPVERVAASLVSWLGGGVQPANRSRLGMFCSASPIWRFLDALGFTENPEGSRVATEGKYFIEVFPALALASIAADSYGRLKGAHYNPVRKKTFRHADWKMVANAAACEARSLGLGELSRWCTGAAAITQPQKAGQDRLDSALCVLMLLAGDFAREKSPSCSATWRAGI